MLDEERPLRREKRRIEKWKDSTTTAFKTKMMKMINKKDNTLILVRIMDYRFQRSDASPQ